MVLQKHLRAEMWELVYSIRQSMLGADTSKQWKPLRIDEFHGSAVERKGAYNYVVQLVPRRLRIFDAVHLYVEGQEVFLPLLPRLLLRRTVREYFADQAYGHWFTETAELKV